MFSIGVGNENRVKEPIAAQPYNGDEILGYWLIPKGLIIKIEKNKSGFFSGTILGGHYEGEMIKKGGDLYGDLLFEKLAFDNSQNNWSEGTVFSPSNNISATLKIKKVSDNKIYAIGQKLFFSKETIWKKIEEN